MISTFSPTLASAAAHGRQVAPHAPEIRFASVGAGDSAAPRSVLEVAPGATAQKASPMADGSAYVSACMRDPLPASKPLAGRQVCQLRASDSKSSESEPHRILAGTVYLRKPDPKITLDDGESQADVNLNCEAHFEADAEPIVCRHLAVAVWQARSEYLQTKTAGQPIDRFSYEKFSDIEKIQKSVPASTEALYDAVTARSSRHHLVLASRWGDFLDPQFKSLKPGGHRHLLVLSHTHVMLAELQVKQRESGVSYRVLMFYDPNQTITHRRVVLDEASTQRIALGDFLPEDGLADYFTANPEQCLAHVIELDPAFLSGQDTAQRVDTKSHRSDTSLAPELLTPYELRLRSCYGLFEGLEDRLGQALARCNPQQAFELLEGHDEEGESALAAALVNGHTRVVEILVKTILDPRYPLAREQRLKLLLAQDACGNPSLLIAIQRRHIDAARLLVDALCKPDAGWTDEKLSRFLLRTTQEGQVDRSLAEMSGYSSAADRLTAVLALSDETFAD